MTAGRLVFGAEKPSLEMSAAGRGALLNPRLEALDIPPLFVTAFIDPAIAAQRGQEALVARYPLALVPQDNHEKSITWKDRVRKHNSRIILLGYQQVAHETTVPGPGHRILRGAKDTYIRYPSGRVPDIARPPRKWPLFDYRKAEWQDAFLEACAAVLKSYPYAGLFLDNCTVFNAHHPDPIVREQLREALQQSLIELRRMFPDTILIGNSSRQWTGLNGEMNEGRLKALRKEGKSFSGHAQPEMDLFMTYLKSPNDNDLLRKRLKAALRNGFMFGAAVTPQKVLWFDEFDEVIDAYANA